MIRPTAAELSRHVLGVSLRALPCTRRPLPQLSHVVVSPCASQPAPVPHTQQEQRLAAVSYARVHLAPWAPQHMPELQRVLAALVFGARTKLTTYKALFSEARWTSLLELFLRELYRLHALLPESALTVHLQVRGGGGAGTRRSCCAVAKQPVPMAVLCRGSREVC